MLPWFGQFLVLVSKCRSPVQRTWRKPRDSRYSCQSTGCIAVGVRGLIACGMALVALLLQSHAAFAQYVKPLDDNGFASADQVEASVGLTSTVVVSPDVRVNGPVSQRGARITGEKQGLSDPGVMSTLLRDALVATWEQCEMMTPLGAVRGMVTYRVGFVEIYAPPTQGAEPQLTIRAQSFLDAIGIWNSITDVAAQQRAQVEATAQQQAEVNAEQERAQQNALANAKAAATTKARLLTWGQRLGVFILLVMLYSNREAIARYKARLDARPTIENTRRQGTVKYGFGFNAEQELPRDQRKTVRQTIGLPHTDADVDAET